MKVTFLFIVSLFFTKVIGQTFDPSKEPFEKIAKQRMDLKIKKELVYHYVVDNNGKTDKKGQLSHEEIYNKWGNPTRTVRYLPKATIITESEYDENGRETKTVTKNGQKQIQQTIVFEYDDKNKIVRIKSYDKNGTLASVRDRNEDNSSVSYDPQGAVIAKSITKYDSAERSYSSVLLTPTEQAQSESKYFFNEKGQVILWSFVDNVRGKRSETRFKYDTDGNRIEEDGVSINGLRRKVLFKYNEKNLVIESIGLEADGKKTQVFRYEYEFF